MNYPGLYIGDQADRCLLCHDAPCSKACPFYDCYAVVCALRFDNGEGARALAGAAPARCGECVGKPCLKVCNRAKVDAPVDIPFIMEHTAGVGAPAHLPSLEIDFCGVKCENPFILASSVISGDYDMCARALDAGWGGVCAKTIAMGHPGEVSPRFDVARHGGSLSFDGFKNLELTSTQDYREYFEWIARLKRDYPSKLVIASIMGGDEDEWRELARLSEQAGADIVECNFSCPQMLGERMGSDVGANPALVGRYVRAVSEGAGIPLIAKLTPNVDKPDDFVAAAMRAGAAGIVAINTVKSIFGVDYASITCGGSVRGKTAVSGYSGRGVKPIALRFVHDSWVAMLDCGLQPSQIAISGVGGIETWRDALDFILLGSSNVQVCTAVMQYGYRIIDDLREGLQHFMLQNGITDLNTLVGAAAANVARPDGLDRTHISYPVFDQGKCIGCGRCYISCRDGGHQAITIPEGRRKPMLGQDRCVGCHLCHHVCPTGAIGRGEYVF